ncbi:MAG: hypothetical protein M3308_09780, partial [Actinomycetota bacterium]|nr:hypothetical protein [Actinomycetota bacterium]
MTSKENTDESTEEQAEKHIPSEDELAEQTSESATMLPAEQAEHETRGGVVAGRARRGMFGVRGTGGTSGYGG